MSKKLTWNERLSLRHRATTKMASEDSFPAEAAELRKRNHRDAMDLTRMPEYRDIIRKSGALHVRQDYNSRKPKKRHAFRSAWSLFLAVLASVVGFRNFAAFTILSATWNGVHYLIPWLVFQTFVTTPLIQSSLAVGQLFEGAQMRVCRNIAPRTIGFGVGTVLVCFMHSIANQREVNNLLYYGLRSLSADVPWRPTPEEAAHCAGIYEAEECRGDELCAWVSYKCQASVLAAAHAFHETIFTGTGSEFQPMHIVGSALVWLLIFGLAALGTRHYASYSLMSLFCMLVMFILVLLSFDEVDTSEAVGVYLLSWNWKDLLNFQIWRQSFRRSLLAVVLGLGLYEALGSFSPHGVNVMKVGVWAPVIDAVTSFGIAFVGFLSVEQAARLDGLTGQDVITSETSYSLIYELFPAGLSRSRSNQITCAVFYFTAIATMVTSGAVTLEGVVMPIMDAQWAKCPRWGTIAMVCVAAFVCSFPFWFSSSEQLRLWCFEIVELYILYAATFQCALVGWMYGREEQRRRIGSLAVRIFSFCYWISWGCMGLVFLSRFEAAIPRPAVTVALGMAVQVLGMCLALVAAMSERWGAREGHLRLDFRQRSFWNNLQEAAWWLLIGDVEICRHDVNGVCAGSSILRATIMWSVCLKYCAPAVLIVLGIHEADVLIRRATVKIVAEFQIVVLVFITIATLLLPASSVFPTVYRIPDEPRPVDVTRIKRKLNDPPMTSIWTFEFMFQEFSARS